MVRIDISRAVREKSIDGPEGSKVWERVRSQGRERCFSFLYLTLIES